ncbi:MULTISPECIES: multidrug efflux SMR transporter [Lysinibacillus]|uniref:Supressor protein SugE n=1 Tax=Lysinibacillus boronitolerans JCM 21713 = 10a = NBRC 103108 TaxID=1294264 RepID=A0ABR4Y0J7_9BACI|nr:multidrug efflux SMR transporter [Lysinibacillus boronitolerans]KGR86571.1 supressor protein SugE [Lysinibacillus boronitolerans JCM 21713 = 10a = NBRC 103108]MCS1392673.1 multidrug efflux SMR transporter [Lysinibacillus boronitolerans]
MGWLFIVMAGLFEVGGIISLKLTEGFTKLKPTILLIVCMGLSFFFLSLSLKEIPISIGYGLWTGIGAAGSVLLGMFIFNEPKSIKKLLLVGGIIISIVGLKLVS